MFSGFEIVKLHPRHRQATISSTYLKYLRPISTLRNKKNSLSGLLWKVMKQSDFPQNHQILLSNPVKRKNLGSGQNCTMHFRLRISSWIISAKVYWRACLSDGLCVVSTEMKNQRWNVWWFTCQKWTWLATGFCGPSEQDVRLKHKLIFTASVIVTAN